jgi:hypothetical protein
MALVIDRLRHAARRQSLHCVYLQNALGTLLLRQATTVLEIFIDFPFILKINSRVRKPVDHVQW